MKKLILTVVCLICLSFSACSNMNPVSTDTNSIGNVLLKSPAPKPCYPHCSPKPEPESFRRPTPKPEKPKPTGG